MIIAERKPLEEIKEMISACLSANSAKTGKKKVLIAGCGTCVTVCMAGGEKEVGILASSLRMSFKLDGKDIEFTETVIERQCEKEFIDELKGKLEDVDMVLSLGCGIGVQAIAQQYDKVAIYPGLNTKFLGMPEEQGLWTEKCAACGSCQLHLTGGICPVARCAKTLLNGPCGGSKNGKCEVNPETDCVWQLIYDKFKQSEQLEKLEEILPVKDWSTSSSGGPGKITREDVKL